MQKAKITVGLNQLIADATVFYQKLRHYHWNVEGRGFFVLHGKFEELYTAWAGVIDEVAERVRTMGGVPVHTLAGVLALASLEEDEQVPEAAEMVRRIGGDLERLHASVSRLIEQAEEEATGRGTVDLLGRILDRLETDLWMLRAWLHEGRGAPPRGQRAREQAEPVEQGTVTI